MATLRFSCIDNLLDPTPIAAVAEFGHGRCSHGV